MKKINILNRVTNFGVSEEYELVIQNRLNKAYQIRYARKILTRILCFNTKKDFFQALDDMTKYTVDDKGIWHYHPTGFIHDEKTRSLLERLKTDIRR